MKPNIEINALKRSESFLADVARPADTHRGDDFSYRPGARFADGRTAAFFADHIA